MCAGFPNVTGHRTRRQQVVLLRYALKLEFHAQRNLHNPWIGQRLGVDAEVVW